MHNTHHQMVSSAFLFFMSQGAHEDRDSRWGLTIVQLQQKSLGVTREGLVYSPFFKSHCTLHKWFTWVINNDTRISLFSGSGSWLNMEYGALILNHEQLCSKYSDVAITLLCFQAKFVFVLHAFWFSNLVSCLKLLQTPWKSQNIEQRPLIGFSITDYSPS